jgi:hypothetical protein
LIEKDDVSMASKPLDNMQETSALWWYIRNTFTPKQHSTDRESNMPRIQQTVAFKPLIPGSLDYDFIALIIFLTVDH